MTTIKVDGINVKSAASPVQLAVWQEDWDLPDLTAWEPDPPGSKTTYICTTTASVEDTQAVVDNDLTAWVDADPGHRYYTVS